MRPLSIAINLTSFVGTHPTERASSREQPFLARSRKNRLDVDRLVERLRISVKGAGAKSSVEWSAMDAKIRGIFRKKTAEEWVPDFASDEVGRGWRLETINKSSSTLFRVDEWKQYIKTMFNDVPERDLDFNKGQYLNKFKTKYDADGKGQFTKDVVERFVGK